MSSSGVTNITPMDPMSSSGETSKTPLQKLEEGEVVYDTDNRHLQALGNFEKLLFVKTPLHAAAEAGNTESALEIIVLMPSLATKLDAQGLSPLHLALKNQHADTAVALAKYDNSLVRVRGRKGMTPLHQVAMECTDSEDHLRILATFLYECPGSINDVTTNFESAVHLVMKSSSCEAKKLMLMWLKRTGRQAILGWRDDKGNSAFHSLAAGEDKCNEEVVKLMLKMSKINEKNLENKTPLDVAEEKGRRDLARILRKAGVRRGANLLPKETMSAYLRSRMSFFEELIRFFCFSSKDLNVEMRNVVLVVAALLITATYQVVLQPPGGYSQGGDNADGGATPVKSENRKFGQHVLGKVVLSQWEYDRFMSTNTTVFTLSIVTVMFLLHSRAYNIPIHIGLVCLAHSYLFIMERISDSSVVTHLVYFASYVLIILAFFIKVVYFVVIGPLLNDTWWVPGCQARLNRVFESLGMESNGRIKRQWRLINSGVRNYNEF